MKQFDFVAAGCFQNRERNLGVWHAGDFRSEFTCLMRAMRELETKNITPEKAARLREMFTDYTFAGVWFGAWLLLGTMLILLGRRPAEAARFPPN